MTFPYSHTRRKPCACRNAAKSAVTAFFGTGTGNKMSACLLAWVLSSSLRMLSGDSGRTGRWQDGHVASARRGKSIFR